MPPCTRKQRIESMEKSAIQFTNVNFIHQILIRAYAVDPGFPVLSTGVVRGASPLAQDDNPHPHNLNRGQGCFNLQVPNPHLIKNRFIKHSAFT
ncbi:hypothetical protein ANRL4_01775 [Anaerolineae bacterium]|nr:hypothetical protein ANRL4_01775 [Anaerolineae bacterium]